MIEARPGLRAHRLIVQHITQHAEGVDVGEWTPFYFCTGKCYSDALESMTSRFGIHALIVRKPNSKCDWWDSDQACDECGVSMPRGSFDTEWVDDAY